MKLVYFSWIREKLGMAEEDVTPPEHVGTVGELLDWLGSRSEAFEKVLEHDKVIRVAVDRVHIDDHATPIDGAQEIALFPPMTGG
ncbi:MAG: MoaD/ThiS family protein [Salaquimonas sp.]|jgi:molybdopterin synthase sulfur carrier subunit|nr:MoaD/ThiS family protein [Salaquimonas sp.]